MNNKENMNQNRNALYYLIAGGAVGAGLALIFAPKSGKEMREDISNVTTKGVDQAKEISSNLSEKAKNVYTQVQTKTSEVLNSAKTGINSTIETAKENFTSTSNEVKKIPEKVEDFAAKTLEKVTDTVQNGTQEAENQAKKVKTHSSGNI